MRFLRTAGIVLVALTIAAGAVSLIGISMANSEQEVVVAEAKILEQGAQMMFKAVDDNIARRHAFSSEEDLTQE